MNPQFLRILLAALWLVSVVGAYLAGSNSPASGKALSASAPPAPPANPPNFTSSLGNETPAVNRTDPAVPSDPVATGRDIPSLIAEARQAMGQGRNAMFSASTMFRVLGPLMELSPDEVQTALAEVARAIDDPQQKMMFESMLLGRWAEQDPKGAIQQIDKLMASDENARDGGLYFGVISSWANRDPEAAWKWYVEKRDANALPSQSMSMGLTSMIFAGMASQNLDLALTRMGQLEDPDDQQMAAGGIAGGIKPESWKRILDATAAFDEDTRRNARSNMLSQWASTNFEATVKLIRELPEAESQELLDAAGYSLMWAHPEKGASLLMETASEKNLSNRYDIIMNAWGSSNPNAAGEWLNKQPPGPAQDQARAHFAQTVVRKDPESAMAWARTVTDPRQRTSAIRNVVAAWSKRDAAAADTALAGSGLSVKELQEIRTFVQKQSK